MVEKLVAYVLRSLFQQLEGVHQMLDTILAILKTTHCDCKCKTDSTSEFTNILLHAKFTSNQFLFENDHKNLCPTYL